MIEALVFTALVLIDVWSVHSRIFWSSVCGVFALVSLLAHRDSLGLSMPEFGAAVRAWRVPLTISAAAVAAGLLLKEHPLNLLLRGLVYFVWCIVQQILLQHLVYRRLRVVLGATWTASLLAGVLFTVVHIPNPVLVPATFVWGTLATRLFEHRPSILAIALLQALLSSLLIWLTPAAWNHQFRVGPGYWAYR